MTDGSLNVMETPWMSRSYTSTTSTFPWHQSVTAFCQWTILSGSYVALSSSVCSIKGNCARRLPRCQGADAVNALKTIGLAVVMHVSALTDNSRSVSTSSQRERLLG